MGVFHSLVDVNKWHGERDVQGVIGGVAGCGLWVGYRVWFICGGRRWGMGLEEADVAPEVFLEEIEMRVGDVTDVSPFPEAQKDVYKLTIDFGGERLQSAAGLTGLYSPAELVGQQVVAVVNLGSIQIAGWESDCLVTGVDDGSGDVVYLAPERPVPNGTRVY